MSLLRRISCYCVAFVLLASSGEARAQMKKSGVQAARDVLSRSIGPRSTSFHFELAASHDSTDSYEFSALHGIVHVRASSPIALTRGAYHYLRSVCHVMITWSLDSVRLPDVFPDCAPVKVTSPYAFRQHFNVCTFGYTTVWWDWNRWEREIDWMALHGINMPLAMVGQEAVWQKVWGSFGITPRELDEFFTGPAFLPWQRMGNVNKHGGPLSQEWIDAQRVLQEKILRRERELGMEPIVPAFSGFVPRAFLRVRPSEHVLENSRWGNFSDGYQTFVLPPQSPSFNEIGRRFIQEYRKTYGPSHYYLADTFNELDVPVSEQHRYDELASFGQAVFRSIDAGDPHGIWVMQGWMFYNSPSFWDQPSTRALLSKVPDNRMIVLDLANDFFHGWKKHDGFYGKKWIYSIIHNFGGNNPLHGDLPLIAEDPVRALRDRQRGSLIGFGMAPEGTDNNEVVYELLTDMAWRNEPEDLRDWLSQYARERYGSTNATLDRAWLLLKDALYAQTSMNFRHALQNRPSTRVEGDSRNDPRVRQALDIFLAQNPEIASQPLFRRDLIELASYYFATVIDGKLRDAVEAYLSGDTMVGDLVQKDALTLMYRLDGLLGNCRDLRLSTWIEQARQHGSTAAAKDLLEENARTQITIWGGPDLHEYASKMWSGLARDFYAGRWELFFRLLRGRSSAETIQSDLVTWENEWCKKRSSPARDSVGDPVREVRSILATLPTMTRVAPTPGITTSKSIFFAGDSSLISISVSDPGVSIHVTTNGSIPTELSPVYSGPFYQKSDALITARGFGHGVHAGGIARARVQMPDTTNGLSYTYYEGKVSSLTDSALATLTPLRKGKVYGIDISSVATRDDDFAIMYEGEIALDLPGLYTFTTESDDGSRVYIDGRLVVDNDGYHGAVEKSGTATLPQGRHRLGIRFFQGSGGKVLRVWFAGPGGVRQELPARMLYPTFH